MGPLLLDIEMPRGAWMLLVGLGWVVGGNALIGLWFKRVHAQVRADLEGDRVFFDRPVKASVSARALLGGSIRWVSGALLVTEEAAVLFQRSIVIAQPPIQLLRQPADARRTTRSMVAHVVVEGRPRIDDGKVVVEGKRGITRMKITLTTDDPRALLAALVAFLDRRPLDGTDASYRA